MSIFGVLPILWWAKTVLIVFCKSSHNLQRNTINCVYRWELRPRKLPSCAQRSHSYKEARPSLEPRCVWIPNLSIYTSKLGIKFFKCMLNFWLNKGHRVNTMLDNPRRILKPRVYGAVRIKEGAGGSAHNCFFLPFLSWFTPWVTPTSFRTESSPKPLTGVYWREKKKALPEINIR